MFSKVLISDDLGSINQGVRTVLEGLGITNVTQVQYCDDAYLKIKSAYQNAEPFHLLITDLSFKSDHRAQTYASGEDLVKQLKQEYPDLKIIVYSVEDRLQKVRTLIGIYISQQVEHAFSSNSNLEINDYDIELLKQLSNGLSQDEISSFLKSNAIAPSSLSSVEKHLNKLRIQFKANNAIHLVAIVKDLGLI